MNLYKIALRNETISAIIKEFAKVDNDYFDEIFDEVEIDGRIEWDQVDESPKLEIDDVEVYATHFASDAIENILENYIRKNKIKDIKSFIKDLTPYISEIIKPWKNKTIKVQGKVDDEDVTLWVKPNSFKYNKGRDILEMSKVRLMNYEY